MYVFTGITVDGSVINVKFYKVCTNRYQVLVLSTPCKVKQIQYINIYEVNYSVNTSSKQFSRYLWISIHPTLYLYDS